MVLDVNKGGQPPSPSISPVGKESGLDMAVKIKFFFLLGSQHRSYSTWPVAILTQLPCRSNFIFHAVINCADRRNPWRYLLHTDVSCNCQSYSDTAQCQR